MGDIRALTPDLGAVYTRIKADLTECSIDTVGSGSTRHAGIVFKEEKRTIATICTDLRGDLRLDIVSKLDKESRLDLLSKIRSAGIRCEPKTSPLGVKYWKLELL